MAIETSPEESLFRTRLRRMSLCQYRRAQEIGGTADTWTDETGHSWSPLSRLGFLWLTAPHEPRNESLMAEMVRCHRGGLATQTTAGEPDLLWAWLGCQRMEHGGQCLGHALEAAFRENGDLPYAGTGAGEGWLAQALLLFQSTACRNVLPGAATLIPWRLLRPSPVSLLDERQARERLAPLAEAAAEAFRRAPEPQTGGFLPVWMGGAERA